MVIVVEHVAISGISIGEPNHPGGDMKVSVDLRLWPFTPKKDLNRLKSSVKSVPCKVYKVILIEEDTPARALNFTR